MMKTKKGYVELSKQIQRFYEDIEQKIEVDVPEWDSDDDLAETEVKAGDILFYLYIFY